MNKNFILDTSAIISLLEDEQGADRVEDVIKKHNVYIPFIVLIEIYYITLKRRGQEIADERYAMLKRLPAKILNEIDEPILLSAGYLKANHPISLADAIIAAYAKQMDAILIHKDPEYEILKEYIAQESLPYKE
ncbi:MAG: PIN domain-containing protein [Acidobacteriota bacterium]